MPTSSIFARELDAGLDQRPSQTTSAIIVMRLRLRSISLLLALLRVANCLRGSDIPRDIPLSSLVSSAQAHLHKGAPDDALVYFDEAINRDPNNYLTIFQRGAAHLLLAREAKALEDFSRVLEIRPKFEGALIQRAKLYAKAGDWDAAKADYAVARGKKSEEYKRIDAARKADQAAEKAARKRDWAKCDDQAGIALTEASSSSRLSNLRATCRLEQGDALGGTSDLLDALRVSPNNVTPFLQVSSLLFYSLGELERGITLMRKCLHSDPDSKTCSRMFRREKQIAKSIANVNALREKGRLGKAADILAGNKEESGLVSEVKESVEEALEAGYLHPKAPNELYASLVETACQVHRKADLKRRSKQYCQEVLELKPHSVYTFLWQAEDQLDNDDFEGAIRTLRKADEHHPKAPELQSLFQKAQMLLQRSKQKDYYNALGVHRDADTQTIKRAYRKLIKQHHPDKVASRGVPKEKAEKKMEELNEAYEVLSDPELKSRFDHGDDPNNHEQQAGGGYPFQYGGGGGRGHGGYPFGGGSQQQFVFREGNGPKVRFSAGSGRGFSGFPGGFFQFT